ncbi:MAG: tetratricopeptide repeat protein [Deltaproteobacteria bacterium]|jgi:Flp pilus assembly protein TadD|nr:tetratricopeptide repeat protein [Deltaproteobacteria bacterium]
MLISQDDARLLGKVAFMGLWQGRFVESETIFTALKDAAPERIGPLLGLGMVRAHKGEYAAAIKILEEQALALAPEDEHAKAWLGLALFRDGQTKRAKEILEPLAGVAAGADVKTLAAGLLEEMRGSHER